MCLMKVLAHNLPSSHSPALFSVQPKIFPKLEKTIHNQLYNFVQWKVMNCISSAGLGGYCQAQGSHEGLNIVISQMLYSAHKTDILMLHHISIT